MTQQDWRVKTTLLRYRLAKFNPNHDERGRFSSGPGGGTSSRGGVHPQTGKPRQPSTLKEGDRVRMPNGVLATVRGAKGRIVEGAIADGDDGNSYLTAPQPKEHKRLGIDRPEPVRVGSTRGDKPRSMSDLHIEVQEAIHRDEKFGKTPWHGKRSYDRLARNVSNRTGTVVTGAQVKRVAEELGMTRDQQRAAHQVERARRAALPVTPSKRPSTLKPFKQGPPGKKRERRRRKEERKERLRETAQEWGRLLTGKPPSIAKFNQNHDEIGRFSDADGNTTGVGGPGADSKKGGGKKGKDKPTKTGDVKEALRLLSEGKEVELETVEQVSTLVKRLNQIVKDAEKKGDKAPSYDLCKVSVANTNIFCAEHKDIPRLKMPQLKGNPRKGSTAAGMKKDKKGEVDVAKQFIQKMKDDGVKVTKETVKSNTLRASQSELVGSKVAGMVASARAGKFDPEAGTIYVSKDGYIIDGHHRWAATIGLDAGSGSLGDRTINVVRIDKPILEVLKAANDFTREIGIEPKVGKQYI